MASNTLEQDAWIADLFGVDPRNFATGRGAAGAVGASQGATPAAAHGNKAGDATGVSAPPPAGPSPSPPGTPPVPPKPPGAPMAEGQAEYEAALKAMEDRADKAAVGVSAVEIGKIRAEFIEPAKALVASEKHDYAGATALLAKAVKRMDLAELRKRRYEAALAEVVRQHAALQQRLAYALNIWPGWGATPIVGVPAAIADAQTKYLDLGRAKADTGNYEEAMNLLDSAIPVLGEGFKKIAGFEEYASTRKVVGVTYDATLAGAALPSLQAALHKIKAETLDLADGFARVGTYPSAMTLLQAAGPRLSPLADVVSRRNAALTAVNAVAGPLVAADKGRFQKDRLDAADALIAAGNLDGAIALLTKAVGEAQAAAAYGAALTAAQAEVDKLTQPSVAPDAARLKTDFIDPAKASALAWDYVGAAVRLKQVPAKVAALVTAQTQADTANTAAQGKVDHIDKAPDQALAAVKKLLTDLEAHPNAASIAPQLAGIRADIAAAEAAIKAKKPDDAKTALQKAGQDAIDARMQAERNGQGDAELAAAKARVAGLPPLAAAEKATIDSTMLQPAIAKFTAGDRAGGLKLLAGIEPACVAAEAVAAQATKYATELPKAETAWNGLVDPSIATDKAHIKSAAIDPAKAKATARDFAGAVTLLATVAGDCNVAQQIAAAIADYTGKFANLNHDYNGALGNLHNMTLAHLPPRPDLTAQANELLAKYITPAQAKLNGRPFGAAGLAAVLAAAKLVGEGWDKARDVVNETYYILEITTQTNKSKAAVAAVKAHPAHGAVAKEIAALDKRLADAASLVTGGQLAAAFQTYQQVEAEARDATTLAGDAAAYNAALTTAQVRMGVTKAAVATIAPIPAVTAALAAAENETLKAAQAAADLHDFTEGTKLLAKVDARCLAVDALVAQQKKFGENLAAVDAALAKLTQPVVADEVKRIRAERVEPAKTHAAAAEYPPALDLLAKATAEAAEAARVAAGRQEAETARAGAQGALDGGDKAAAVDAVQKLLDALLAHKQAALIKDLTDHVTSLIAAAKNQPPPAMKLTLTQAADLCVRARTVADESETCARALANAEAKVAALTSPLVVADKAKIQKDRIDAAKVLAVPKTRDFTKAIALLDTAVAECASAQDIVTKDAAYQTALTAAQAALDGLHAIAPVKDPAIGDDALALLHTNIDAAKALVPAPKRDYEGAMKLLADVAAACKSLALKKSMAADTPPTKAEIAAIMAQPGGTAQLDKMVDTMPDTTKPAVLQAAIEARFGIQSFQNLTKDGAVAGPDPSNIKSLKKIYAMMSKVPQQNVVNNASLQQISLYGGSTHEEANSKRGSFYSPDSKSITLSCGRADDGDPQPLSNVSLALPNIEPDCELKPDSEVPVPKYFDWTTLHEVGHAIDDKQHFMDHRAGNSAFGGWQMHGNDVAPIAAGIAGKCNLVGPAGQAYLAAYLAGAKAPEPPAPPGHPDWAKALQAARDWCDAIRVDKELWESGAGSSGRAINDRVYHEAYAGTWVSYDLAARTKGITGYQFRAPGEWFSELYAAFHTNKLKPSHPAMSWLTTV